MITKVRRTVRVLGIVRILCRRVHLFHRGLALSLEHARFDVGRLLEVLPRVGVSGRRGEDANAAVALDNLARPHVADAPLEPAAQQAVEDRAQGAPDDQAPSKDALLARRPSLAAGQRARRLPAAHGQERQGRRDDDEAAEEAGGQAPEGDAAVGPGRHLAQVPRGQQAGLAPGQDAQLGAEGVGGDGGVVGDDADDEDVARGPRVAKGALGDLARDDGALALLDLPGVQQDEDRGDGRVGQDLDVGAGPLAAAAVRRAQRQLRLDVLFHLGRPRARQEEDDEQHERQVPRVPGVDGRRDGRGGDARGRQRLVRVGPVHEGEGRRDGDDGLHGRVVSPAVHASGLCVKVMDVREKIR